MASRKRSNRSGSQYDNSLRIIGGKYRGRLIAFPDSPGLRPTSDRIRETVFNWLQVDMPDAVCLDLFAGSGALGFEAASRGAASVTLIENAPIVAEGLSKNISVLSSEIQMTLFRQSALDFINNNQRSFDIVFLDPPFLSGLYGPVINALDTAEWMRSPCKIYIECPKGFDLLREIPPGWELLREKSAGKVDFRLFRIH